VTRKYGFISVLFFFFFSIKNSMKKETRYDDKPRLGNINGKRAVFVLLLLLLLLFHLDVSIVDYFVD